MTDNESHIGKLKGRLAAGEITVVEYEQLLNIISDKISSETINPTKKPAADPPLLEIKNKELGTITLFSNRINIAEREIGFEEIKSIRYFGGGLTISFFPVQKDTIVTMKLNNSETISIQESRVYFSSGAHKALVKLYSYVSKETFQTRLDHLAEKLRGSGKLVLTDFSLLPQYDDTYLSKSGIVTKGNVSVNLKEARRRGTIQIGRNTQVLPGSVESNPNIVIICEEKIKNPNISTIIGGRLPKTAIEFTVYTEDKDITHSLLLWLSIDGNHL